MMAKLEEQLKNDLHQLTVVIGERPVGSPGNRRATEYVAKRLASMNISARESEFDCLDWEAGTAACSVDGQVLEAFIAPYTLSCDIEGDFAFAASVQELKAQDFAGKIAVLHGELCKEQLSPKNFTFYNPEHHQLIISLLEEKNPRAIVAITGKNPELTGALYPFPLIEDGDFDIPVAYMTLEEGEKLLARPAGRMTLLMQSKRIPTRACNVIGYKTGSQVQRLIFCAHIDTKNGTPGAIDNGGGVAILLALSQLLADYQGKYSIELLFMNGEDYWAYSGGMQYLAENREHMEDIVVAVNSDGVGSKGSRTTFCCFDAAGPLEKSVKRAFREENQFMETAPWYQSDHMLFVMNGRPAVALTTGDFAPVWANIAHTERDTIELLDSRILLDTALGLRRLIDEINRSM